MPEGYRGAVDLNQSGLLGRIQRVGREPEPGRGLQHGGHLTGVVHGGDQQRRLRCAGELPDPLLEHAFQARGERRRVRQPNQTLQLLG